MAFSFAHKNTLWLVELDDGEHDVMRGLDVERALSLGQLRPTTPMRAVDGADWTCAGALAGSASRDSLEPVACAPTLPSGPAPAAAPPRGRRGRALPLAAALLTAASVGAAAVVAALHGAMPSPGAVEVASAASPRTAMGRGAPEREAREGHVARRATERQQRLLSERAVREWKDAVRELKRRARGDGLVRPGAGADPAMTRWDPLASTL